MNIATREAEPRGGGAIFVPVTLAQRLKCSKCGSTKVGIMVASYVRARDHPDHRTDD